jgi:SpoIIAA-like
VIDFMQLERDEKTLFLVTLCGRLTAEQYRVFPPQFESELPAHDALSLLFDLREFKGWEPMSRWKRLSFDSKHRTSVARVAIVGPLRWRIWMARACVPLGCPETREFLSKSIDGAFNWLGEGLGRRTR